MFLSGKMATSLIIDCNIFLSYYIIRQTQYQLIYSITNNIFMCEAIF